jgi:hypothetical protein
LLPVQINTAAKEAKSAAAEKKQRSPAPRITFDVEQYEADAVAAAQGAMGSSFQPDPYDGHLNHQELTKTLLDLSALYRDARMQGVSRWLSQQPPGGGGGRRWLSQQPEGQPEGQMTCGCVMDE